MQKYKAKTRLTLQEDYNQIFATCPIWSEEGFQEEMAMVNEELAEIETDIKNNEIKKYDAPSLSELEEIIEKIKIYKENPENKWYHSEVILHVESAHNKVFLSGIISETEDKLSESFLNYQNAAACLIEENHIRLFLNHEEPEDYSEDAIGGVFLIYQYSL